jgi:anaerobic selenocysteine-containing dehydrogenase
VLCYVKEGKLVKVEGDPEHPYNQGHLCPRCVVAPDMINHPDRLKAPMKRDRSQRGNPDAWEVITWNEAFDLAENQFRRYIDEFGSESIQGFHGTGRDVMWEVQRLCYAIGTPNAMSYASGLNCWMPRCVAHITTTGMYTQVDCSQFFEDRYDHPEWKTPEVIIIWGNNCVQSSSDGFFGDWIVQCMKRGSKLIVIDPRLTWLAAQADLWLQIRPCVDDALILGLLHVIIREDLYDHDFVDQWTYGFEEFSENVKDFTPERVSEITWIPQEKIEQAARMFAKAKPGAVQLGLSLDMQTNGVSTVRAILSMVAICGDIDIPGGNCFAPNPGDVNFFGWGWDQLAAEQQEKLVGYNEYPLIRMGMRVAYPDLAIVQAETDEPYPFKAAFMMGTNPLTCMSMLELERVYKALQKLEFTLVCDYVMTPTIQAVADLVYPIAMFPERESIRSWYVNLGTINHVEGLERNGDVKSDQEIILELGSRFNKEMFPWDNVEGMLDAMLEPSGITFHELQQARWWYPDITYRRHETGKLRADGQPGFPTPTGLFELYSTLLDSIDTRPLSYYEEPHVSPISTPELYEEYPMIVLTGTRNIQYFHSEHRQIKKLREIQPDPLIELHPDFANANKIREGDWVWIENTLGRIKHRAHLTLSIHPKIANVNSGWWFPEIDPHDDPMYGCWDVNPNILIPVGKTGETGFGSDTKNELCKIYKCEEAGV